MSCITVTVTRHPTPPLVIGVDEQTSRMQASATLHTSPLRVGCSLVCAVADTPWEFFELKDGRITLSDGYVLKVKKEGYELQE